MKNLQNKIAEVGFFKAIPESRMARQLVWWKDVDSEGLRRQIDHVFLDIPDVQIKFLRIFTPTVNSMDEKGVTREIKANFQKEQFLFLDRVVGAQKVLDNLKYSHFESLENYDWHRRPGLNEEMDDDEIVKMFNFLHKLKIKEEAGDDSGHGSGLLRRDG